MRWTPHSLACTALLGLLFGCAAPEESPPEHRATHAATAPPAIGLSEYELRRLREAGLPDPEREILEDLQRRPALIPEPGVLGGTMRWLPPESVVLNGRWVLATFEDGHVRGQALLGYTVVGADSIEWRLIETGMD